MSEDSSEEEPGQEIQLSEDYEYDQAIRDGTASFDQYASTYYYSEPEFNSHSEASRRRYARYKKPLFDAFIKSNGRISSTYYCNHVPAAGALTAAARRPFASVRRRRLSLHILSNVPENLDQDRDGAGALDLMGECEDLSVNIDEYLTGRWHSVCMDMTYGLLTDALATFDAAAWRLSRVPPKPVSMTTAQLTNARKRLVSVNSYFQRAARKLALLLYLRGVFVSAALLTIASLIVFAAVVRSDLRHVLASCAAGAVGALASVLTRVSRDGLKLDFEVGRGRLFLLGLIRPVLGVISGIFAYALARSGILPLATGTSSETAMFAVLGFVAGFSERFAEDMLAYTGSRVGLDIPPQEPEAPIEFDEDSPN